MVWRHQRVTVLRQSKARKRGLPLWETVSFLQQEKMQMMKKEKTVTTQDELAQEVHWTLGVGWGHDHQPPRTALARNGDLP